MSRNKDLKSDSQVDVMTGETDSEELGNHDRVTREVDRQHVAFKLLTRHNESPSAPSVDSDS